MQLGLRFGLRLLRKPGGLVSWEAAGFELEAQLEFLRTDVGGLPAAVGEDGRGARGLLRWFDGLVPDIRRPALAPGLVGRPAVVVCGDPVPVLVLAQGRPFGTRGLLPAGRRGLLLTRATARLVPGLSAFAWGSGKGSTWAVDSCGPMEDGACKGGEASVVQSAAALGAPRLEVRFPPVDVFAVPDPVACGAARALRAALASARRAQFIGTLTGVVARGRLRVRARAGGSRAGVGSTGVSVTGGQGGSSVPGSDAPRARGAEGVRAPRLGLGFGLLPHVGRGALLGRASPMVGSDSRLRRGVISSGLWSGLGLLGLPRPPAPAAAMAFCVRPGLEVSGPEPPTFVSIPGLGRGLPPAPRGGARAQGGEAIVAGYTAVGHAGASAATGAGAKARWPSVWGRRVASRCGSPCESTKAGAAGRCNASGEST